MRVVLGSAHRQAWAAWFSFSFWNCVAMAVLWKWLLQKRPVCGQPERAVLGALTKTVLWVKDSSLAFLGYKNRVERDNYCSWKQRILSATARWCNRVEEQNSWDICQVHSSEMRSYKMSFLWSLVNLYLNISGKTWDTFVLSGLKPSSKQTFCKQICIQLLTSQIEPTVPFLALHMDPLDAVSHMSPSCVCAGTCLSAGDLSELSGQSTPVAPPAPIRGTRQSWHLICHTLPSAASPPGPRGISVSGDEVRTLRRRLSPQATFPLSPSAIRKGQGRPVQSPSLREPPRVARSRGDRGRSGGRRADPAPGAGQGMRGAVRRLLSTPSLTAGRAQPPPHGALPRPAQGPLPARPGPARRRHRAPSWARSGGNSFIACSVMGFNSGFVSVGGFGLGFCFVILFFSCSFSFCFFFFCPPEMDTEIAAACFPLQLSVC